MTDRTSKSTKLPSVSLILLAFNEEASLDRVLDEAVTYAKQALDEWEIVIVNDGSSDGTADIAAARCVDEPRIRVVTHPVNRGMGAGMASGIEAAQCRFLVFLPADGQTPVRAIDRMMPLLEQADIVVTTYDNGRDSFMRTALSAGLRGYMRATAGIRFQLEGLYVFPVLAAKQIAPEIKANTFFFSFELIDRGLASGLTLRHTTMSCLPREAGASKVANLRRIARVGREVARYAGRKRFGLDW